MPIHSHYLKKDGSLRTIFPVTIRFSEPEKRKLTVLAQTYGLTVPEYIKRMVFMRSMMGMTLADEAQACMVRGTNKDLPRQGR